MSTNPGTKFDGSKARWDLFNVPALRAIARVLTFGANKYTDDGWHMVPDARRRYYAAALRHLTAWWESGGAEKDPETGESHLAHVGCCVLFLLAFDLGAVKEVKKK